MSISSATANGKHLPNSTKWLRHRVKELYPNPVQSELFMQVNSDLGYTLAIRDVLGREVKRQEITSGGSGRSVTIDTNDLSVGSYFVVFAD